MDNIIIKNEQLNKQNLEKIMLIDKTFYKDEIDDINWYYERYNDSNWGTFMYDNEKLIGYIVSVPVKKELYDAFLNEVLINDFDINPEMYINDSYYNYISSILLLEEYRGKGLGKKLVDYFFNDLTNGKYLALTITENGKNILKNKMNLVKKINNNVFIFEKEIKK